ncbi:MAG: VWA domain-containing protein [Promethearchaeota archaeon]
MFQTSSKYFPAQSKILRGMPWVGRVAFAELKEKVKEISARPIVCASCGAALTNPDLIKIHPSKGKTFTCEFCGTLNVIPKDLMPGTDLSEFILGRLTTAKPITEDTLLAVIDISGSMGGGKLAAVKDSLIRTITDLGINAPKTTFGLIAFHSDVYIYDEKMSKIITLSGDIRYSVDKITKEIEKALKKIELKSLEKTRKKWVENVEKLQSLDMTALGPAIVSAYVIMKERGGRIILLTDGLANEGVGALESASSTGAQLYEDLSAQATNAGIIIDVVAIKDPSAFMALEALAVMPMQTGGTMYYAELGELSDAISAQSRAKIIARNVRLRIIAPKGVDVAEVSGLGQPKPEHLQRGIHMGPVTEDRELYVRLSPKTKVKEKEIPIQLQVTYMDDDGKQRIRVVTQRVKVTEEAKPIIDTLDAEMPATFAVQRAGEEQYRGDVAESREILEKTQQAMRAIGKQAPKRLAKEMERVDHVLTKQIKEAKEVAVRQEKEAAHRAPMRASQVAAIADEDAASSMQRSRQSSKRLFEEEED